MQDLVEQAEAQETEQPRVYEAKMVLRRLGEIASVCQQFRRCEEETDRVFWVDRNRSSRGESFARFAVTPLEIASLMREAVFEPYETVICTSATLSINGSFAFWKGRMGLSDGAAGEVRESIFPSPFAYKERVLLGIPSDAPLPDDPAYVPFLGGFVGEALERSGGSGLILFTSYDMLRRVYDAVKPRLSERGISVFRQGEDDRSRLLDRFRSDTASVLFATDSFWEGVDAPGEALRLVILCRLPFKVPTDPVLQARMEAIRDRGGNPFMELSLPEAVMNFQAGVRPADASDQRPGSGAHPRPPGAEEDLRLAVSRLTSADAEEHQQFERAARRYRAFPPQRIVDARTVSRPPCPH